jgi:hypothetical protein
MFYWADVVESAARFQAVPPQWAATKRMRTVCVNS